MKSKDILELVAAMAPAIDVHVDELIAPFRAQLKALEQHNESLRAETILLQEHIKELQKIEVPTAESIAALVKVSTPEEIAALVVVDVPTAEDVAALVPKPKDGQDGKSVDAAEVVSAVTEHVLKQLPLLIPAPVPGKDADPTAIKAMVDEAVSALPKDGKDVDLEHVKAMVDEAVKALPPAAPGKDADPEVIARMVVNEVEARLKELPKALTAEDVNNLLIDHLGIEDETVLGAMERVAESAIAKIELPKPAVDVKAFEKFIKEQIDLLPKPKDGESVTVEQLAPLIAEQVNLKVAALPRAKDGVGLAGAIINRDGELALTLTDGTVRELGKVVGERGQDGIKATDFEIVDREEDFVVRVKVGDQVIGHSLTKPSIADHYKGIWSPGLHKRGSLVTWGGSLWMAQRDTEVKPETKGNDDWKLVVKRGRDGKDFTPTGGK